MSTNLLTLDAYEVRARLIPGLVVGAPALIPFATVGWKEAAASGLLVIVAVVVVAQAVRSVGQRAESRLWSSWGGAPTTIELRLGAAPGGIALLHRRSAISKYTGMELPSAEEEAQNPALADEMYVAATRAAIGKLRHSGGDDLVNKENCSYGFWRNLFALRWVGVTSAVIGVVVSGILTLNDIGDKHAKVAGPAVALALCLCLTVFWAKFVDESRVRQAADAYARVFFDAVVARV